MKKKDFNEVKKKSVEDLSKVVSEKEQQLKQTLIELKLGKVKNVHTARALKKELAKIKTIIAFKNVIQKVEKEP